MQLTRTAMALVLALLGAPAAYGQEPAPTPRPAPPQPAPIMFWSPDVGEPKPPTVAKTAAPPQRAPVPSPPPAAAPQGPRLGSLSVVLLEGDTTGTASLEGVPTAVQSALADMREFLPFRSYRLHDAGLLRAPASGASTIYLRGEPAGRRFAVTLSVMSRVSPTLMMVSFSLREVNADNPVLETVLMIDVGETVIVGTSRTTAGDKALIALLTAVPAE